MKLSELAQELAGLGHPVTYSHFNGEQTLPFLCYLVTNVDTFSADNKVISETLHVDIELYTRTKNLKTEQAIKKMLNENELPWDYDEVFIKTEGVFKCTFSITLIN